jgi:hypothetical protein
MRYKKYFRSTYDEFFLIRTENLYLFRPVKRLKDKFICLEDFFVGDHFREELVKKGKYKILNTKKMLVVVNGFIRSELYYVDIENENKEKINVLEKNLYDNINVDFGKHLLVEIKRY